MTENIREYNEKPNVLLIICDQLRYDTFSYMDHQVLDTPNIDRLVNEGVLFKDAICTSPLCGPSRGAMLTGLYQTEGHYREKNVEPNEEGKYWLKNIKTGDEILDENGYHVEYHGKWHCGKEHRECYKGDTKVFGHALNDYHDYLEARHKMPTGPEYKIEKYTKWPYRYSFIDNIYTEENIKKYSMLLSAHHGIMEVKDEDTLTAYTVDKTVDFLEKYDGEKPFSVTCSILHPHLPFTPNQNYGKLFKPEDMNLPDNINSRYDNFVNKNKEDNPLPIPDCMTFDMLKENMALYYGLIKEIDDHVGRLLTILDDKGLTDNTIVVFCSDHGNMLGAHSCLIKLSFFEESVRVPLIFRYPNGITGGYVSNAPATCVDIVPTILDLCGIKSNQIMHGESLKNAANGRELHREFAFSSLSGNHCLRSHKWKIMYRDIHPDMVFDLENDPGETNNLLNQNKDTTMLKELLDDAWKDIVIPEGYTFTVKPEVKYVKSSTK